MKRATPGRAAASTMTGKHDDRQHNDGYGGIGHGVDALQAEKHGTEPSVRMATAAKPGFIRNMRMA